MMKRQLLAKLSGGLCMCDHVVESMGGGDGHAVYGWFCTTGM